MLECTLCQSVPFHYCLHTLREYLMLDVLRCNGLTLNITLNVFISTCTLSKRYESKEIVLYYMKTYLLLHVLVMPLIIFTNLTRISILTSFSSCIVISAATSNRVKCI